jgi:tetratricopeptide (TPR) repeat protein
MTVRPGLSVCMIVRNERRHLDELLPVLAREADEVIVVDTGSSDGTIETARARGARVILETWRDDFAKARNASLDAVSTSHAVWLDADDRIDAADLAKLRRACLDRPDTAFLLLLVNESHDPSGVTSCFQMRAFPARPEHRFTGRVHEQILDSLRATGTRVETLDVTVRHTGYVNPEEVIRKARRNLELLRRETRDGNEGVGVLYHWMKAAQRAGEPEEAMRIARRILERPPEGTPDEVLQATSVSLAAIEFQRGEKLRALDVLREAVARVPNDPIARFFLGDFHRRCLDFRAARVELEAARVAPIRHGALPMPVTGLRRAIRMELGEVLEKLGLPAEAAAVYREALDERPEDRPAARSLVRTLLAAGMPAAAAKQLDALPHEESDAGEVLMLRATIAFDAGRDAEAGELFARAVERVPRAWPAWLHLGHLAMRAGRVEEAKTRYAEALRLCDTPETRLGMAAGELESGRAVAALDHLARAVEACAQRPLPRGSEALSGEALLRTGRVAEALGAFEKHLERHGRDARILARVADCYRILGAAQAARLGYEEALRMEPGLPAAVGGLAELTRTAVARESAQATG